MYESLLVNISKYAASDKNSPIENFITEAFAWLLRNDGSVREAIATFLHNKSKEQSLEIPLVGNSGRIDTQVNFNGKYPDMCWESKDHSFRIIFEHKIWSELHDKQLDNYRKYAEEKFYEAYALVLITAHIGQHKQSPDLALCWYQIAEEIEKVKDGNDKEKWVRGEFINLLKSNGLIDMSPINPLSISYYNDVKKLDKQLYDIAIRTANKSWPIQQLADEHISYNKVALQRKVGINERIGRYDAWGRIGLEFNNVTEEYEEGGWAPGFFCGFVIDDEDHCINDLMSTEPLAVLIMDIDEPLHPAMNSNVYYKSLVNELILPKGWHFSDRTTKNKNENPWHPLIIYQGLTDFIGNATTLEQQSDIFFQQMTELQQALLNCASFVAFCKDMHRLYGEKQ
ncbi:PD-(D/E)XK nuclease family protein [Marinomonas spartinae]|uniref:PD-(D/E)XK nuclease family protein n=1 Tax=Marinomonas spartinae TaxID=1792290 RepID=UPI0018F26A05|nr:PD-(D/E)XK nuclease family protein [Marinomonas spartinae]MBJ7555098.1 PD-(D/E)XK nuclease family protein [Marinomonas spartinae]